jgi:ApbE superfamily uncharacterized protein (UPF0280 family)
MKIPVLTTGAVADAAATVATKLLRFGKQSVYITRGDAGKRTFKNNGQ